MIQIVDIAIILLSIFSVAGWSLMLVRTVMVKYKLPKLSEIPDSHSQELISVIIPAKNEAQKIRQSIESLLSQSYFSLELIVINDRSNDDTGAIINDLANRDQRIKPIHISELPAGWLGKNHANQHGAAIAQGKYVLFTDADILFSKDVLSKTVSYVNQTGAKHVVVYPKMLSENIFEEAFLSLFGMLFAWKFNPIGAKDPKNKRAYIGVGAFNFIERKLYSDIGEHHALKVEIADDVKLGFFVKQNSEGTHVLNGNGEVRVRWREGLWDSMKGIERSAFAGVNFSWAWVWVGIFGTLAGLILPYWLIFFQDVFSRVSCLLSLLFIYSTYALGHESFSKAFVMTILHPIMALLFLYAFVKSAILVSFKGGIEWRGNFYKTEVLKSTSTN